MTKVGVIGLGDMGSGLAKNLIRNGFETHGYDLSEERMAEFITMGGMPASSVRELAQKVSSTFLIIRRNSKIMPKHLTCDMSFLNNLKYNISDVEPFHDRELERP